MKNTELMPAAGYLRRSTDRQEQSIGDQRTAVERYAAQNGFKIVRFYTDDAISGTSTRNRKAFLQLVADAQDALCPWRHVLVYDVKRFGRLDNDEAGYYRYILRQAGINIVYVTENFSGDDSDDLLRPVKQWQARQESKDLSRVTIRGQVSLSQNGWWMGGAPPYGYDLLYHDSAGHPFMALRFMDNGSKEIRDLQGRISRTLAKGDRLTVSKREHASLIPSAPERTETIRRIFDMYVDGYGFKTICHQLNLEGLPSPRNGDWAAIHDGRWAMSTIRSIVVNPVYRGAMVWNRRTLAKFHRISKGVAETRATNGTRKVEGNKREDWVVIENAHTPLVDEATFTRAQRLREVRRRRNNRACGVGGRGRSSPHLLTGLVRCAACGHRFQAYTVTKGKSRKDGTRVRTHYYACGGYVAKGTAVCKRVLFRQDILDACVLAEVGKRQEAILAGGGDESLVTKIELMLGIQDDPGPRITTPRVVMATTNEKVSCLLDLVNSETRGSLERKLADIREEGLGQEGELMQPEEVHSLRRPGATGSWEERRRFIRAFVDSLTLYPDEQRGELHMKQILPTLWPGLQGTPD